MALLKNATLTKHILRGTALTLSSDRSRTVIQKNTHRHARPRPAPSWSNLLIPNIPLGQLERQLFRNLNRFWKNTLTTAQRTAWNALAATASIKNYEGKTITPTGHQLWIFINGINGYSPYQIGHIFPRLENPFVQNAPPAWQSVSPPTDLLFASAQGELVNFHGKQAANLESPTAYAMIGNPLVAGKGGKRRHFARSSATWVIVNPVTHEGVLTVHTGHIVPNISRLSGQPLVVRLANNQTDFIPGDPVTLRWPQT